MCEVHQNVILPKDTVSVSVLTKSLESVIQTQQGIMLPRRHGVMLPQHDSSFPSLTFMKHEGWFHYGDRGVRVTVCAGSGACQMKFIYAHWLNGWVVTAYVASNISVM